MIIKELIKHENKFKRKVFHDKENSENRFWEFSYFMKGFKKYVMNIYWSFTKWNYHEIRISWNALKEIFHSVSSFLGVYAKRWRNVHVFQNTNLIGDFFSLTLTVGRLPIHRKGDGLTFWKKVSFHAELNERAEAAISSYSTPFNFYNIVIQCLWLRIIRRSDQGV